MNSTTNTTTPSHHVRTFFATICGVVAVWLILSSILFVWLNRTLTNTTTFTTTVTPLLKSPAVETFVTNKISDMLVQGMSVTDAATVLLPPDQIAGQSEAQIADQLHPIIAKNVKQVLDSPAFTAQWQNSLTTIHQQFVSQLNAGSGTLTLNFNPLITEAVNSLGGTQLAPLASQLAVTPDIGKVNLKGSSLDQINRSYRLFKAGTIAGIVFAAIALATSIALSVHHLKTLRWILFATAVGTLAMVLLIKLASVIKLGNNVEVQQLGNALSKALLHNLQVAYIIIAIISIAGAFGTLAFQKLRAKK